VAAVSVLYGSADGPGMFCTYCGREVPDGVVFCPGCGARLSGGPAPAAAPASASTSSTVAAISSVILPGSYHLYRGDYANGAGLMFSYLLVLILTAWAGRSDIAASTGLYAAVLIVCAVAWISIIVLAAITAVEKVNTYS